MLRRNIYAHNAKIYRARKEGRSSPQRRSHLVVLTLRNLSPNRSQKRPIYHLNCESQASLIPEQFENFGVGVDVAVDRQIFVDSQFPIVHAIGITVALPHNVPPFIEK